MNEVDRAIGKTIKASLSNLITFLGMAIGLSLIWSLPTMVLWNWIIPDLFGLAEITLVKAWGLKMFIYILFGSNKVTKTREENKTKISI